MKWCPKCQKVVGIWMKGRIYTTGNYDVTYKESYCRECHTFLESTEHYQVKAK